MIDRLTLEILMERARRFQAGTGSGLSSEEVITVLAEYEQSLDLLDQAATEGFRTPVQKKLDQFLAERSWEVKVTE